MQYASETPAPVRGFYEMVLFPHVSTENLKPETLTRNEDVAWREFVAEAANHPVANFTILPHGTYWATLLGEPPSSEQMPYLLHDPSAALLLMGTFRWAVNREAHSLDFCILILGDPPANVLCQSHNGPRITAAEDN